MGHSKKTEPTLPIKSPELKWEIAASKGPIANKVAQEILGSGELAEREELGSNTLRVATESAQ